MKPKHIQDVIDEYLKLLDEQIEIPLLISKNQEKYESVMQKVHEDNSDTLKPGEAKHLFELFSQNNKYQERKAEVSSDVSEIEKMLKKFLTYAKGHKIAYEKKGAKNKKLTYLLWLKDGKIECNR